MGVWEASTTIWTTGTSTHPLIKDLAVGDEHRGKQGRLEVTPTMQLVGGAVVGVVVARKLLQMLGDNDKSNDEKLRVTH